MAYKQRIGRWGEDVAAEWIKRNGFEILGRNVRTPYGELDIIGSRQGVVVFFEVKTRTSDEFGMPESSITPKKKQHLIQAAEAYLQEHDEIAGDWRVDIIALRGKPGEQKPQIEWFENAISQD